MWLCVLALITLVTSSRLQTTLSELSSNSSVCVLPPYPQYGIYEVANVPSARPGQSYSTAMLTVKCRRGFGLADQPGSTDLVFCVNGLWLQSMPRCVRFCRLDPDPSVRYMCYVTGRGVQVCEKYVPPGTIVSPVCNTPNYYSNEMLLPMTCVFGYWNYIARCKAECGRITPSGIDLVIDGTAAKRGELPWHVGIYRKTNQSFEQICGGSLVSENVVISAAHCFWSESRMILTSKYAVAIGKLHRPWDSEEDADAQKSEVKEIRIPALYQGAAANFQEDLSVIILTTPFNYTTYIRPVCLNFGTIFDSLQLQHGKLGKVAGWGFTTVNGIPSQTLNVVEMPFISVDVCLNALPQSFIGYVTSDKFCAGYTNGTVLCKGDSGGGLVFLDKELGVDRFYLRGIASTAPNEGNKLCNDNTYITFTKISKHQDFIKGVLAASAQKLCPMYSFQCNDGSCVDPGSDCNGRRDCADGSDESEEYCLVTTTSATVQVLSTTQQYVSNLDIGPVLTTQSSKLVSTETDSSIQASCGIIDNSNNGNSPWLAAIYMPSVASYTILTMGTLLTDRHVITAATHIYYHKKILSLDNIVVQFGSYNSYQSYNFTIIRHVQSVSFIEIYDSTQYGISVLTVNQRLAFNRYIKPVCLWDGDMELSLMDGTTAMFATWDDRTVNYFDSLKAEPHVGRFTINRTLGFRANNESYQCFSINNSICTRYNKPKMPCLENMGGGLYVLDGNRWRLRGVLVKVFTIPSPLYDSKYYGVFTDTAHYLSWIKSAISENSLET